MSNSPLTNRFRRAKSEVTHSRSSVGSLRNEFRDRFFSRLRKSRSKSVDRFRQIVEDYGDEIQFKSISDLRKTILIDKEARSLLKSDEINDILNEIERELAQVTMQNEGELHITENDMETADIINRHLKVCSICNSLSEEEICHGCSMTLQSEFN